MMQRGDGYGRNMPRYVRYLVLILIGAEHMSKEISPNLFQIENIVKDVRFGCLQYADDIGLYRMEAVLENDSIYVFGGGTTQRIANFETV